MDSTSRQLRDVPLRELLAIIAATERALEPTAQSVLILRRELARREALLEGLAEDQKSATRE